MPVQIEKLQKVPYFSELTLNELESIRRLAIEKIVARGELIVMEGDAPASIYFLISGAVKMFKTSPDGKEQIFHIACPGESFNEVSALDGNANMFSVQSMGEVTLYEINRRKNMQLLIVRLSGI